MKIPIVFPPETEGRREAARRERGLSPTERLLRLAELLEAAETMSLAGSCREAQLRWHRREEEEGRRRLREFLARHAPHAT